MEFQILVVFRFHGPSITLRVSSSISFDDFKNMLLKKGVTSVTLSSSMVFSVENHPESDMNNNDDWENMMFLLDVSGALVATITSTNFVEKPRASNNFTHTLSSGSQLSTHSSVVVEQNEPHIDLPITSEKTFLTASWSNYIQCDGQLFKGGVKEFRIKLAKYHIEKGYQYRFTRNTKHQEVTAECVKRASHGCKWYVNATSVTYNKFFNISILHNEHTCPMEVRSHKRLSAALKALLIVDEVRSNPDLKPVSVKHTFKKNYGLDISYKQAWRAIEQARVIIFGVQIKSYMELKWILLNLKQVNQDSLINFEAGPVKHSKIGVIRNRFIRAFISFRASIDGFAHCRPMLCLDGTFLSGKYGGTILAATAKDGQNGLFPVVFAVVPTSNGVF